MLSWKQKESVQGKPRTKHVWEIRGLSFLAAKALPEARSGAELPSIFPVLQTLCSGQVFLFGDPRDVCISGSCIALTTSWTRTLNGHSRRQARRKLSQDWWAWQLHGTKMSVVGRDAVAISGGSCLWDCWSTAPCCSSVRRVFPAGGRGNQTECSLIRAAV